MRTPPARFGGYIRFERMTEIKSICVYCGSQPGNAPDFTQTAENLGKIMAKSGVRLVYGGGTTGIMGAISGAVKANGGEVLGIIPDFLLQKEANLAPETHCTEVIVTENMHRRKQLMFEHADAFVTLPGGIGTLEEIIEMMTWAQLGRHEKPMCFVEVNDFWKPLFELIEHMEQSGFIHTANRVKPLVAKSAETVLETLRG